jgi:hypothetical protein
MIVCTRAEATGGTDIAAYENPVLFHWLWREYRSRIRVPVHAATSTFMTRMTIKDIRGR